MRAVVVFSGGQDSTTCLYWAICEYGRRRVQAVTFNYNQRHQIEVQAAVAISRKAGVDHEIVRLGPVLAGDSPLVSDKTPAQYDKWQTLPGGLEATFVPLRNQLFLTLAANRAYVARAGVLVTGVGQEDFGGYPDCRRQFISAFEACCNEAAFTGEDGARPPLKVQAPLMQMDKRRIVELGLDVGAYAALAYSHTAYDGAYPPVGRDHASLLRAKGFEQAGVPDPLVLRAWAGGLMPLPDQANYKPDALGKVKHHLEHESWANDLL